jgi:hypothetical protein
VGGRFFPSVDGVFGAWRFADLAIQSFQPDLSAEPAWWKDGLSMILRAEALSPEQKSVIEEILGRRIQEAEAISLRAFEVPAAAGPVRLAATVKLRGFLEETDRRRSSVSDEEFEAALLESIRSERPHYTPVS